MSGKGIRTCLLSVAAIALAMPALASDEPFQVFVDAMRMKRTAQLQSVEIYVQRIKNNDIPGMRVGLPDGSKGKCLADCRVFKVEEVTDEHGNKQRVERLLSAVEVQRLAGVSPEADDLDLFSLGLVGTQATLNQEFDRSGATAGAMGMGLPIDNGEAQSDKPWLSPYHLMSGGSVLTSGAADSIREADQSLATSQAQAQAEQDRMSELFADLENVGTETMDGRRVTHFQSRGQSIRIESPDGPSTEMTGADVWVDPSAGIIVGHRMIGTMTEDNQSREFYVDVRYSDFRDVPGCDMYEPYRRKMSMGGMMNDEQMAQMQEARQQLEEFERQMAAMPPGQREMAERMMGDKMDMMRSMASGGAVEHIEEVEEIICNPDLKALFGVGVEGAATVSASPENLLQQIQLDLTTLGYKPGNTNGVLDMNTQIAISQYEAEKGMSVTGEPSQAVAQSLAADVAAQGG